LKPIALLNVFCLANLKLKNLEALLRKSLKNQGRLMGKGNDDLYKKIFGGFDRLFWSVWVFLWFIWLV
ncbi:MAG: hypothetical protein ACK5RH_03680, partial [Burkholderiales bacterium]